MYIYTHTYIYIYISVYVCKIHQSTYTRAPGAHAREVSLYPQCVWCEDYDVFKLKKMRTS